MGDQKRKDGPRLGHLVNGNSHEVGRRQVFIEYDQDRRPCPVVINGPVGGVVTKIGGETLRHGDRPYGAPLPLQEEGPFGVAPLQEAEGVRVYRAHAAKEPEIARGPEGRVQLRDLPSQGTGLPCKARHETMYRRGMFHVA